VKQAQQDRQTGEMGRWLLCRTVTAGAGVMRRSIHLSNVAVQENYVNGKRSEKIPENNFMTSEQLKDYLRYRF